MPDTAANTGETSVETTGLIEKTLLTARSELERRPMTSNVVDLVDVKEGSISESCFPAGTLTLVLARQNSKLFSKLVTTIRTKKGIDKNLLEAIKAGYDGRAGMPLDQVVSIMKKQPNIGSLAVGRFTLAQHLFIPAEMELIFVPLAYNGGSLDGVPIVLHDYRSTADTGTQLQAIVVRSSPTLSLAEAAALKLLPPNMRDRNVAPYDEERCWGLTAVGVAATVIAATSFCPILIVIAATLGEKEIEKLGPELTALELIALRRYILARSRRGR